MKAAFPELFGISHFKKASVADHLQFSNKSLNLNITFNKPVHDWEVKSITLFFNLLYSQIETRLDLFTTHLFPMLAHPFLGKAFGEIKLHLEWCSLYRRQFREDLTTDSLKKTHHCGRLVLYV